MSNKCPKCGSIRIIKASEDVNICLACESLLNTINSKSKPTLFNRITASPKVLAKELITTSYDEFKGCTVYWAWLGNGRREAYYTEPEAIAATVEKLNEVCSEQTGA